MALYPLGKPSYDSRTSFVILADHRYGSEILPFVVFPIMSILSGAIFLIIFDITQLTTTGHNTNMCHVFGLSVFQTSATLNSSLPLLGSGNPSAQLPKRRRIIQGVQKVSLQFQFFVTNTNERICVWKLVQYRGYILIFFASINKSVYMHLWLHKQT